MHFKPIEVHKPLFGVERKFRQECQLRPGHEHSLLDAVAFPSYPRLARLERDLMIWLIKEVFDKLQDSS
ncbi:hypothetical protein TNCV_107561 [Trichonephila clavipes]|nr:hypothetical protein TNCV_107561 [Trichonephila clavipes]